MECKEQEAQRKTEETQEESCDILQEIHIEDLTVDGICGVY